MSSKLLLAQVAISFVMHELANWVGAINNCAELLDSRDVEIRKQASEQILKNSDELVRHLKFYRYAYGIHNQSYDFDEIIGLVGDFFCCTPDIKIELSQHLKDCDVPWQLIMCFMISAQKILFRGGVIKVYLHDDAFCLMIEGKQLKYSSSKKNILNGEIANVSKEINPVDANEYYIVQLLRDLHYNVSVELSDTFIKFNIHSKLK